MPHAGTHQLHDGPTSRAPGTNSRTETKQSVLRSFFFVSTRDGASPCGGGPDGGAYYSCSFPTGTEVLKSTMHTVQTTSAYIVRDSQCANAQAGHNSTVRELL